MPDITMCSGNSCEVKETCYRYRAIPSPYWQSFFMGVPDNADGCQYFWAIEPGERLQPKEALEKEE